MFSPRLATTAGNIDHEGEERQGHFVEGALAVCNVACIDVHEVVPTISQVGARGDFEDWAFSQAIRGSASRGEKMQVHTGSQLQGATDKVAGRRRRKDQAFLRGLELFARAEHVVNGAVTAL